MRRLARWLLNALTILSLLLVVTTVLLWAYSYTHWRPLKWDSRDLRHSLFVNPGRLTLSFDNQGVLHHYGFGFRTIERHFLGIVYWRTTRDPGMPNAEDFGYIDLPVPWLALAAALPLLLRGLVMIVKPRPFSPGHCPACSYDLTGNVSGICPECGTAVAKGTI